MKRTREKGEGRLGLIIALALVAIGIFLGVKIIPVRVAAYEFQDFVQGECRYAAVRRSDDVVKQRILQKAKELDIPLRAKHLLLQRKGGEMVITASYEKPIDLKVYTYVYAFQVKERAPLF